MYCSKCGKEISNDVQFCPYCGNKTGVTEEKVVKKAPTVMLDPSEVVEHKEVKDSSETFAGQGRMIGLALMIVSILFDVVGIIAVGSDSFISIITIGTILFVIGFLLRMFSP